MWLFVRDILNDIRGHFGLGEIGKNEDEVIALKEKVNRVKAYIN